jgi:hypothetical protein
MTANFAPSSLIMFNLKMEVVRCSASSVLTRATQSHIPEDGIIQGYMSLHDWNIMKNEFDLKTEAAVSLVQGTLPKVVSKTVTEERFT